MEECATYTKLTMDTSRRIKCVFNILMLCYEREARILLARGDMERAEEAYDAIVYYYKRDVDAPTGVRWVDVRINIPIVRRVIAFKRSVGK